MGGKAEAGGNCQEAVILIEWAQKTLMWWCYCRRSLKATTLILRMTSLTLRSTTINHNQECYHHHQVPIRTHSSASAWHATRSKPPLNARWVCTMCVASKCQKYASFNTTVVTRLAPRAHIHHHLHLLLLVIGMSPLWSEFKRPSAMATTCGSHMKWGLTIKTQSR